MDNNTINVAQQGGGAHTATILLYGTQPTTLNLTQINDITKSYSINQNCATSGGCTINVTQE